jgi:hypothetical protein
MRTFYIIALIAIMVTGCKKKDDPVTSGTVTIDNLLYGTGPYYALGFEVKTGAVVSTLDGAQDVIVIMADADINNNVRKIFFAVNNFKDAFSLYGEYADASQATAAFDNLTSFTDPVWTSLGDNVKPNQVWLFRTSTDTYAKIRIISTVGEKRNDKAYAECTLQWVYQPDGTKTFQE